VVDQKSSDDMGQTDNDSKLNESLTDEVELTENLIKRSCQWPQLRRLIFRYNNLERIDESIVRIISV